MTCRGMDVRLARRGLTEKLRAVLVESLWGFGVGSELSSQWQFRARLSGGSCTRAQRVEQFMRCGHRGLSVSSNIVNRQ